MKKLKLLLPTAMLFCLTLSFFSSTVKAEDDGPTRKFRSKTEIVITGYTMIQGFRVPDIKFIDTIDCDQPGEDCYEDAVVVAGP